MRADLGRMFKEPAQAVGDADDFGIAERGGFAFDVMGGAEQRIVRMFGHAEKLDRLPRRLDALAFGLHPVAEFGRELNQSRFGPRHRIVVVGAGRRNGLAQLVRRRDHFVVGVSDDQRSFLALIFARHFAFLLLAVRLRLWRRDDPGAPDRS